MRTEFAVLVGATSGGVAGYQSGGWKGAVVGAVMGGTVAKAAPWATDALLPYTEGSGVGVMLGRTAIFSGVNGFGSGVSTVLTNAWIGRPPSDDVVPSIAIGAFAPVGSGESFLWGAGGDHVYGKQVANGFSWITGGVAIGATGLDPAADHGFLSVPPPTQENPFSLNYGNGPAGHATLLRASPSNPNYGDGPAGQATPLNLEPPQ